MSLALASQEEDSWDVDQRNFEMVERLEKAAKERLPDALKVPFIEYARQYSGLVRLPIFKMFEVFQWDSFKLVKFYTVLTKLPKDLMPVTLELLESFIPYSLSALVLELFHQLRDFQVVALVVQTSREDCHRLVQVLRHQPDAEIRICCELIERLSCREVLQMLQACGGPRAKACRLCKSKRMHSLEQHMLAGQVPAGLIKVVGTLPLFETKFESWSACDERGYTFNHLTAEILWHKTPVDILQVYNVY